jgi:hypothetical protein
MNRAIEDVACAKEERITTVSPFGLCIIHLMIFAERHLLMENHGLSG